MGGREGVVDIGIAEAGEGAGEAFVVGLLAGVEAGVLKQQHAAVGEPGDGVLGRRADAVGGEGDRAADGGGDGRGQGGEAHVGLRLALGAAEMGEQDHPRAPAGELG